MSKNFEEEYKALARQDAPDLWDRIEAGLAPKAVVSPAPEEEDGLREMASQEKTSQRKLFFIRYKTVIAAAVCVLVILPAVMFLRSGQGSVSSQSVDQAAGRAMPEAAAEMEEAESTEEAETAEAAAEEFAMDDATEESAATDQAVLASTETLGEGTLTEKQQNQMVQADTEISIEIEVLSKISSFSDEIPGDCYEVRILDRDAGGIFAGGETITLCQPVYSSAALRVGESCQVVIRVEPEAEYPYTLLRYAQ